MSAISLDALIAGEPAALAKHPLGAWHAIASARAGGVVVVTRRAEAHQGTRRPGVSGHKVLLVECGVA